MLFIYKKKKGPKVLGPFFPFLEQDIKITRRVLYLCYYGLSVELVGKIRRETSFKRDVELVKGPGPRQTENALEIMGKENFPPDWSGNKRIWWNNQ